MVLKAVFLDIDGTLVNSNEFHVIAWAQAFRESGHSVARAAIRKQIGKGSDMLIPALLPYLDQKARKEIADRHGEIFQSQFLPQVKAFPQAAALIAKLHADRKQVLLASSAKDTEVEHYVRLLDVQRFLTATTSADDVANSKPAGDIFASA